MITNYKNNRTVNNSIRLVVKSICTAVFSAILFLSVAQTAQAAITVNPTAVAAIDYIDSASYTLRSLSDFYSVALKFIGPSPSAGYSMIRTVNNGNAYSRIFESLARNQKMNNNDREKQLWESILDSREKKGIAMIMETVRKTGASTFSNKWPRVPLPNVSGKNEMFDAGIRSLLFIVPTFNGVMRGSPDRFDSNLSAFLKSGALFYPVITFEMPADSRIMDSVYASAIVTNVMKRAPGATYTKGLWTMTIFPEMDSFSDLTEKTRKLMVGGNESSSPTINLPTIN